MWPYFLLVLIIFLMQFHINRMPKCGWKAYVGLFVLFLFAGLRGSGDGDYFNYINYGRSIKTIYDIFHNSIHMDTGYCILAWIVNYFRWPSQMVIILMNLISISCIGITIHRYSKIPVLSVLVFLPFFFQFDMHAARTAVAMGILTLSVPYILDRKPLKFGIVLALSMLFHPEAAIGIVLYFLPRIKINGKIGIMVLLCDALFVKLVGVDRFVLQVLSALNLNSFYRRFYGYTESVRFGYAANLFDLRILLVIVLFVLTTYLYKNPTDKERFMINSCFMCAFVMIFFSEHSIFVYRLSSFYNIYTILLVPMFVQRANESEKVKIGKWNINIFVVIMYTLLSLMHAYNTGSTVEYKLFELSYWM